MCLNTNWAIQIENRTAVHHRFPFATKLTISPEYTSIPLIPSISSIPEVENVTTKCPK